MMKKQGSSKIGVLVLIVCLVALLVIGWSLLPKNTLLRGLTGGGKTGAWLSVRLFPDRHGWALTVLGVFHTEDAGQHWHNVTPWTAADFQFGGRVDALSTFVNGDDAWLVRPARSTYVKFGQNQKPEQARSFRTTDAGKTWQRAEIPDTASTYRDTMSGPGLVTGILKPFVPQGEYRDQVSINGISAINGRNAWVTVSKSSTHTGGGHEDIVFEYSRVWHSNDGGKTWKLLAEQKPAGASDRPLGLGWIYFMDAATGLMTGTTPFSLAVSRDSGAHWVAQDLPTQNLTPLDRQRATQGQATFFDAHNGVIPMQIYTSEHSYKVFQYVTHDRAKTWQMSTIQEPGDYHAAYYLDAQHWMLMQGNTALVKTVDGGATWNTTSIQTGFAYISDMTFVSSKEGWALGRNVAYLQGNQYSQDTAITLLKTTNSGQTWTQASYTVE
ncbi:MAG: hypothetical protein H0W02_24545 [Ktedonobacteraceae bacterium]|nr:hypothetical protein [Ktedonobacteraceae bacterium]